MFLRTAASLSLSLCLLMLVCRPLAAGPTRLVPSLSLRTEYRDNILLTASDEKKDLITIAAGGISLEKRTLRLDARLRASLNKYLYTDFTQWNSSDRQVALDADYRVTQRLSAGISGNWRRDEPRGSDTTDTGIAVTGERDQKSLSLSGAYRTSEAGQVSMDIHRDETGIERDFQNEDNTSMGAGIEFSRDISQYLDNTSVSVGFNWSRYDSETRDRDLGTFLVDETLRDYTSETQQAFISLSGRLTETTGYYLQAGAGRMDTQEIYTRTGILGTSRTTARSDSWYGLFGAGLTWTGQYHTAALSGYRDVREGVGTNGAVERTSLSLDLTRRITEDFTLSLDTALFLNQNKRNTAADRDELTLSLSPGFRYRLSEESSVRGGCRFTRIDDREGNSDRGGSLVYLEIYREFPQDMD